MGNLITNLEGHVGAEGPVILLTWNNPDVVVDAICVMRKRLSYPEGPFDGAQVIEITSYTPGAPLGIIDDGIADGGVDAYYYTVMSRVGASWYLAPSTRVIVLSIQTVTFDPKLIRKLPEIFGMVI